LPSHLTLRKSLKYPSPNCFNITARHRASPNSRDVSQVDPCFPDVPCMHMCSQPRSHASKLSPYRHHLREWQTHLPLSASIDGRGERALSSSTLSNHLCMLLSCFIMLVPPCPRRTIWITHVCITCHKANFQSCR